MNKTTGVIFGFLLCLGFLYTIPLYFKGNVLKDISVRNQNFNDGWEFKFKDDSEWKPLDLPHDFSIIQKFDENCEGESGFLPGGSALYRKKFTIKKPEEDAKVILYFYGSYKDTYVTLNGNYIGENHYGYDSFGFEISKFLLYDQDNLLEVKVENEIPSSRWYSGSGIFRDVELIITGLVHVELDGLKILTPDIEQGKGTVKVEAEVVNEDVKEESVKLSVIIKDKNGVQVAAYESTEFKKIDPSSRQIVETELEVEKPTLWFDTAPYLYTLELKLLNSKEEQIDHYNQRFGFRFFKFDNNGFHLNNKSTKLNGVSNHHDHGAIGSVDNYDAVYRQFKILKDMGCNSIRTTHNIASKIWINLADELGIIIVEEFFDGWTYSKNGNVHDFGEYFNKKIEDKNNIYGKKEGMTWSEFALTSVIRRDRNNPSIVMWSLGNELSCNAGIDETYVTFTEKMIAMGNQIDSTRPFTTGDNNSFHENPNKWHVMIAELIHKSNGVEGFNYAKQKDLEKGAQKWGSVYLSESASAINSRGIYSLIENGYDKEHDGHYHLTSYDTSWVSWGYTAQKTIWYTISNDFVSGQYVWTGFDYIGEPTPWNPQSPGSETGEGPIPNSAYFGIIDTCGFPKDSYYLYRAQQNHDSYTVHIVNAWDENNMCYSDLFETMTPVFIYTNALKVEIYRNDIQAVLCTMTGKKVTTKAGIIYYTYSVDSSHSDICEPVDPEDEGANLFGRFNIQFVQGTKLYTKAYDENGTLIDPSLIVGKHFVQAPNRNTLRIQAVSDKTSIKANGYNLAHIEISIVDSVGILDTTGSNLLKFKLDGPGKILGVDNGDQATVDKYQQKSVLFDDKNAQIKAFTGKALVMVSGTKTPGKIRLNISSEGLENTVVEITTN